MAKYDPEGRLVWARQAGGIGSDGGGGVVTDRAGNGLITGKFNTAANFEQAALVGVGKADIFLAKYDPSGTLLWVKGFGGIEADEGKGIAIDGEGHIVLTGFFRDTATFDERALTSSGSDDIFIAKYDSTGALLWAKQAGGSKADQARGVTIDAQGHAILTGFFRDAAIFNGQTLTSAGSGDIFATKLDISD